MKQMFVSEPARRGGLRLWLGKRYFCARRWLWWHTSGVRFARRRPEFPCPSSVSGTAPHCFES